MKSIDDIVREAADRMVNPPLLVKNIPMPGTCRIINIPGWAVVVPLVQFYPK